MQKVDAYRDILRKLEDMNALVVYFSKFGNTQMVAEAIAQALEPAGSVRVLNLDDLTVSDLQDADLIVMGSPTHNMSLPKAVRRQGPVRADEALYRMG